MTKLVKIPSWISQPIYQIVFFFMSYSLTWSIISKMGYLRRDVSWGILMEYLFILFTVLSILLGISKYFKIITSRKLSILFATIFLIGSGYFLSYSLTRLGLIWILATMSTVIAHWLSNRKLN
jgi:hypothetical protein